MLGKGSVIAVALYLLIPIGTLVSGFTTEILVATLKSFVNSFYESPKDTSIFFNAEELILDAAYSAETHKVETEDGYILTLHRIPFGRTGNRTGSRIFHYGFIQELQNNKVRARHVERSNRLPVLIQHGIGGASDSWLMQGPTHDLAYLLADAGYDVWLGNSRGSYYSRAHRNLSASDDEFWNFSFHELGYYDTPAVIDHILATCKCEQLYYIGHSMGTTMFFVMTATRPEYNRKIKLFFGLAPVAKFYPEHMPYQRRALYDVIGKLVNIFDESRIYELFPRVSWGPLLAHALCREGQMLQDVCLDLVFFWAGVQSRLIQQHCFRAIENCVKEKNFTAPLAYRSVDFYTSFDYQDAPYSKSRVPLILSHVPAGLSLKTVKHYMQLMKSGKFQYYDYGDVINLQKYKQKQPPEYYLNKTTCPVSIHYSSGDHVVDAKDVAKLIKSLKTVIHVWKTSRYNHVDFMWSHDAKSMLYSEILGLMKA